MFIVTQHNTAAGHTLCKKAALALVWRGYLEALGMWAATPDYISPAPLSHKMLLQTVMVRIYDQ